jgi:hypothetical protein
MFWLIHNNVSDEYEITMNFLDFTKLNIDNNNIYIFNNTIQVNHIISITCNIKIKENIILYEFNGKQLCFSFQTQEYLNEPKIKYYYKKENIEKMPVLLQEQYDFNDIVVFNIDNSNDKNLIINELINGNYRNYNIS